MLDIERKAARRQVELESRKRPLTDLLGRAGSELVKAERASSFEVRSSEKHLWLSVRSATSPNRVIQAQVDPVSKHDSLVTLREMDYQRLMELKALGGNEMEAVTREIVSKRHLPNLVDSFGQLLREHLPLSTTPKKAA